MKVSPPGCSTWSPSSCWSTGSSSSGTGPMCRSALTTIQDMFICKLVLIFLQLFMWNIVRNQHNWYRTDDYFKDSVAQSQENARQQYKDCASCDLHVPFRSHHCPYCRSLSSTVVKLRSSSTHTQLYISLDVELNSVITTLLPCYEIGEPKSWIFHQSFKHH